MNELALFAGAGGRILGDRSCSAGTVPLSTVHTLLSFSSNETMNSSPLTRMTFRPLTKTVESAIGVFSGGFPIKTSAPQAGLSISSEHSGLWRNGRDYWRVRPRFVFVKALMLFVGSGSR